MDKVQHQSLLQFSDSACFPACIKKVSQRFGWTANPFADWPGEDLNPCHQGIFLFFSRFNLFFPRC